MASMADLCGDGHKSIEPLKGTDRRHWRIVPAPLAPVLRARTACSSVSLSTGCADDRCGVCGLRGAAAVALRGPLGGPVLARLLGTAVPSRRARTGSAR